MVVVVIAVVLKVQLKRFKFIGKGWKKELISVNNGGGGHCGGLDGIIKTLNLQNKVKKTNLSVFPNI